MRSCTIYKKENWYYINESLNEFKRVSSLSKKLNKNIDCIIRINPENMDIKIKY